MLLESFVIFFFCWGFCVNRELFWYCCCWKIVKFVVNIVRVVIFVIFIIVDVFIVGIVIVIFLKLVVLLKIGIGFSAVKVVFVFLKWFLLLGVIIFFNYIVNNIFSCGINFFRLKWWLWLINFFIFVLEVFVSR